MPIPTTEERLGSPQRIVRFFALIMALVYLALGVWFLSTVGRPTPAGALLPLGAGGRIFLGAVFVLYGLYRLVTTLRTQFRKTPPDELD